MALGEKTIHRYRYMLEDLFTPVSSAFEKLAEPTIKAMEIQVQKELGIYDLLVEKAKLEERIKEIDIITEQFTRSKWNRYCNRNSSVLEIEVQKRLISDNTPYGQIIQKRDTCLKDIQFCDNSQAAKDIYLAAEIFLSEISNQPIGGGNYAEGSHLN
jgi:hypothetical protein